MVFKLVPMDVRRVLEQPPPRPAQVLPGLVRGHVGVLCGTGAAGKTTLAQQIAVCLAAGLPTAGRLLPAPAEPIPVALVTGEEHEEIIAIRLHSIVDSLLDAEPTPLFPSISRAEIINRLERGIRIYPCSGKQISLLRDGERTEFVSELAEALHGCHLAFVETVSRLHDGDENSATEMTALVNALESVAVPTNCAVVAIHQTSKAAALNSPDSPHAARGSVALTDNCRWQANLYGLSEEDAISYGIEHDRKTYLRFEITKANYIPPHSPVWLRRMKGGVMTMIPSPTKEVRSHGSSRRRR
jgi:hypothetical protein